MVIFLGSSDQPRVEQRARYRVVPVDHIVPAVAGFFQHVRAAALAQRPASVRCVQKYALIEHARNRRMLDPAVIVTHVTHSQQRRRTG